MLSRLIRQFRRPRAPDPAVLTRALQDAVVRYGAGDAAAAEQACRALLAGAPEHPDVLHLLAMTLSAQGQPAAAADILSRLVDAGHGDAQVHFHLGGAWRAQGETAPALAQYRAAVAADPGFAPGHLAAGEMLQTAGRYAEAEQSLRAAIACAPGLAEAHYALGNLLRESARCEEAAAAYRCALAARPGFAEAHGNLLYALLCDPGAGPAAIYEAHLRWGEQQAAALTGPATGHEQTADAGRRLRIGYVSPDLYNHSVAYFIEPLLARHDRSAFEVWCYCTGTLADEVTARLRGLADQWVEAATLDDDALAARIRADRIDLLVDLDGHFRDSRLAVFARKPAPVQATYLGYPTTTGLTAIDYRITDGEVDPPGEAAYSSERPVRLPGSYFCYRPHAAGPAVGPLPAARNGHVTFGSFNNTLKFSEASLALWARVLQRTPRAALVLKAKGLAVAGAREALQARFARHGIEGERLRLRGWEGTVGGHLEWYNEVDIALDTYPYNGATTTCEALWMGVPVVTLRGATHPARMGASLLRGLGLAELIADDAAAYVDAAARLAADTGRLAALRAGLRERMRASPLMDEAGFTLQLEKEYRHMWETWCRGRLAGTEGRP